MNIALIIAGGIGVRMNQEIPKQFLTVDKKPIIVYTMENFQEHPEIDEIVVVCVKGWEKTVTAYAKQYKIAKLKHIVLGGDCGQSSIRNGLFEIEKYYSIEDNVLIHDAIRPFVSPEIISDCIVKTKMYGSGISSVMCAEAMLCTEDNLVSSDCYPREKLKRTQTPQGFKLGKICEIHRKALKRGIINSVASCTLMHELGEVVYFSAGSEKNIKLTTLDDMDIFEALLNIKKRNVVGIKYDEI